MFVRAGLMFQAIGLQKSKGSRKLAPLCCLEKFEMEIQSANWVVRYLFEIRGLCTLPAGFAFVRWRETLFSPGRIGQFSAICFWNHSILKNLLRTLRDTCQSPGCTGGHLAKGKAASLPIAPAKGWEKGEWQVRRGTARLRPPRGAQTESAKSFNKKVASKDLQG